jgi:LmbE family N-acetylglucosaminyl deacetylase
MKRLATRLLRGALRRSVSRLLPVGVRDALRVHQALVRREQHAETIEPPSGRVVVLAPHPDDEAFGCGGTLARASAQGANVHVVFMTDGARGYDPARLAGADAAAVAAFEAALRGTRRAEAAAAGQVLGLAEPVFLDLPDGGLRGHPEAVPRLAEALSTLRPDVVMLPWFADPHPDHWATVAAFHRAAKQAGLPASTPCWGYEVWSPMVANAFVDIGASFDAKQAAMMEHRSQLADVDYVRVINGLSAYRSLAAGFSRGNAEAFFVETLDVHARLFDQAWPGEERR